MRTARRPAHSKPQISAVGCTAAFPVRGLTLLLPQCLQPPYAPLLLLYRALAPRELLHLFRHNRAFGILIGIRKWNLVPRQYRLGRRGLSVDRGNASRPQDVGPPELQQRPCGSQPPPSERQKRVIPIYHRANEKETHGESCREHICGLLISLHKILAI